MTYDREMLACLANYKWPFGDISPVPLVKPIALPSQPRPEVYEFDMVIAPRLDVRVTARIPPDENFIKFNLIWRADRKREVDSRPFAFNPPDCSVAV